MSLRSAILLVGIVLVSFMACQNDDMMVPPDDPIPDTEDLTDIPYSPQPYDLQIPPGFPPMEIPVDNPMTVDGVELGRFLFYDPILSADSTQSCSSCHLPVGAFTDNQAVSVGIAGVAGERSAMSLLDIGFVTNGLFWDGRSSNLEDQALIPIEDPIELNHSLTLAIDQLQEHETYPAMFRKAFGIERRSEITPELLGKALAQFERSLISSGQSKFDQKFLYNNPLTEFSESEFRGFDMFFDIPGSPLPDAQCFHCHNAPLFTVNDYFNNGLQEAADLNSFDDPGRGAITGLTNDNGKMRAPTLRNIALTAPYMHDGRFQTLEEVMDFYNEGVHYADNLDENLVIPMGLTEEMKEDVINFLHTLTDTAFVNNPAYQNPFKE
jgi:cytochrome c peroxidase